MASSSLILICCFVVLFLLARGDGAVGFFTR